MCRLGDPHLGRRAQFIWEMILASVFVLNAHVPDEDRGEPDEDTVEAI